MPKLNTKTRWTSFAAAVALIWFFLFHAGPALRDFIPQFRNFAETIEQTGINAGAIYYTDVEIVGHADINARSTFEHTPTGPD